MVNKLGEAIESHHGQSTFKARKEALVTIDRTGASLTIDQDQHYGGTTRLKLTRIVEIRQIGLAGSRDTVLITAGPGDRPCGILFDGPDTAASFAAALSRAVSQGADSEPTAQHLDNDVPD